MYFARRLFGAIFLSRLQLENIIKNRTNVIFEVKIGNGAVVTKNALLYKIVGGVLVKHIKLRFDEKIITFLQKLK